MSDDPFDPRIALAPLPYVRIWLDNFAGHFGLVSEEDYAWITRKQWSFHIDQRGKAYVRRCTGADSAGRRTAIYLHREVMRRISSPPTGQHTMVDHINGHGLDNRRDNLRWVTPSENAKNLHGIEFRQPMLIGGRWL
jgi:HNH endonuclease